MCETLNDSDMVTSSTGNIFWVNYWPFVKGLRRSPLDSPHKGQWRGALMFSLICACTSGWGNNQDAGYLRRHRAHYDVTVMNILNNMCSLISHISQIFNILRPRQNGRPFADDIFKYIFLNENLLILNKISLKYFPYCLIDNISALVQIMAWRRTF